VAELFDMRARALRRDRAAQRPELFLHERAFADCLDRLDLVGRRFERALLIGCPDEEWPRRLGKYSKEVEVRDPGPRFAAKAHGSVLIEDAWVPAEQAFDLVLALGTLDSVNELPVALRLVRHGMRRDALFLGAFPGGENLPRLRSAMRAADAVTGFAAPHVHPRIEASAVAPLLVEAGFVQPVIDVDRVPVSYASLGSLVGDLRAMAATNILSARPRFMGRLSWQAAQSAFTSTAQNQRTIETFEIIHFAAWTQTG